jgi:hypothetical protein
VASRLQSTVLMATTPRNPVMGRTPFAPKGGATMKTHGYTYQSALEAAERIDWRV